MSDNMVFMRAIWKRNMRKNDFAKDDRKHSLLLAILLLAFCLSYTPLVFRLLNLHPIDLFSDLKNLNTSEETKIHLYSWRQLNKISSLQLQSLVQKYRKNN